MLMTEASSPKTEDLLPANESDEVPFMPCGGADVVEASHDPWRALRRCLGDWAEGSGEGSGAPESLSLMARHGEWQSRLGKRLNSGETGKGRGGRVQLGW